MSFQTRNSNPMHRSFISYCKQQTHLNRIIQASLIKEYVNFINLQLRRTLHSRTKATSSTFASSVHVNIIRKVHSRGCKNFINSELSTKIFMKTWHRWHWGKCLRTTWSSIFHKEIRMDVGLFLCMLEVSKKISQNWKNYKT